MQIFLNVIGFSWDISPLIALLGNLERPIFEPQSLVTIIVLILSLIMTEQMFFSVQSPQSQINLQPKLFKASTNLAKVHSNPAFPPSVTSCQSWSPIAPPTPRSRMTWSKRLELSLSAWTRTRWTACWASRSRTCWPRPATTLTWQSEICSLTQVC